MIKLTEEVLEMCFFALQPDKWDREGYWGDQELPLYKEKPMSIMYFTY